MRRRTRWKRLVEFAISSVFCISKSIYHGAHKFSLYICAAMIFGYIVGLCQLNVCNIDNNDYTVLVSHTILSPELECTITFKSCIPCVPSRIRDLQKIATLRLILNMVNSISTI